MMCQNSNGRFNNRIKFKFSQKVYIKIMRCKICEISKAYVAQHDEVNQKLKSLGFTLQYRLVANPRYAQKSLN